MARFERIKLVYREIAEAFSHMGLDHLVLKGFAQWPAHMQHPRLRVQSDIDLYCLPESCAPAMDALTQLGYRQSDSPSDQHLPPVSRPNAYRWHGLTVDGFSLCDVVELARQADAAAECADYRPVPKRGSGSVWLVILSKALLRSEGFGRSVAVLRREKSRAWIASLLN